MQSKFWCIGVLNNEPIRRYCYGNCGRIVSEKDGVLLRNRHTGETALFCRECAPRYIIPRERGDSRHEVAQSQETMATETQKKTGPLAARD